MNTQNIDRSTIPNKILGLWALPRSTSTAFETMMRARGDFHVINEPFALPYYFGKNSRSQRYSEAKSPPECNYQNIWEDLKQKQNSYNKIFFKELSFHVGHIADPEFMSHFRNTFLIRHPSKTLPSLFAHWADFVFTKSD